MGRDSESLQHIQVAPGMEGRARVGPNEEKSSVAWYVLDIGRPWTPGSLYGCGLHPRPLNLVCARSLKKQDTSPREPPGFPKSPKHQSKDCPELYVPDLRDTLPLRPYELNPRTCNAIRRTLCETHRMQRERMRKAPKCGERSTLREVNPKDPSIHRSDDSTFKLDCRDFSQNWIEDYVTCANICTLVTRAGLHGFCARKGRPAG